MIMSTDFWRIVIQERDSCFVN